MALVNDAGLGVITEGCKTSHGGIVLPISRPFTVNERAVAIVGDMTHCPQCRGDFPIAEGDGTRTWHDKPMAFHGHKTACGATLISETAPPPMVELINAVRNGTAHDEQFQLKDDEGNPLPNCDYTIKASDGQIFRGTTDEQGYSVRVFTTKAESLAIHLGDVE